MYQVSGVINPDCTLQGNPSPSVITSSSLGSGHCKLLVAGNRFNITPVFTGTIIGNAFFTSMLDSGNATSGWTVEYVLSAPALVFFTLSPLTLNSTAVSTPNTLALPLR